MKRSGAGIVPVTVLLSSHIFAGAIIALALTLSIARADGPHFLDPYEELLRTSCESALNNNQIPVDLDLPPGFYDTEFDVPLLHPPVSTAATTCQNFGWVSLPAFRAGTLTVTPINFGRKLDTTRSSDAQFWDCNHSSIQYAVYARPSLFSFRRRVFGLPIIAPARWVFHGGGQLWGWLVNGECTYSVTDPGAPNRQRYTIPSGWGRNSDETPAFFGARIAVLSWSHNDVTIGHTGKDCADPINCWWGTKLRIVTGQP
jgi:hypothetical protein